MVRPPEKKFGNKHATSSTVLFSITSFSWSQLAMAFFDITGPNNMIFPAGETEAGNAGLPARREATCQR